MISCYFGSPGCGKSSILTLIAQTELKRIKKGKSKYKHVYTNFPCSNCEKIDFFNLGNSYYHDALIILDEVTLSADSRDWKNLSKQQKEFKIDQSCDHRENGDDQSKKFNERG